MTMNKQEIYKKAFEEKGEVWFYSDKEKPYGCFSNFSRHPTFYDDKVWPTSEHYFQAQKFILHPELVENIRLVEDPMDAAILGRRRDFPLRRDWDEVKDRIMFDICLAKFQQHKDIQRILLDTEDSKLVEHTNLDNYWADGGDGTGQNQLGITLMKVRDTLRNGVL